MTDSKIEWTEKTWNPWIGCTRTSPGCKNCYAGREEDTQFRRLGRCLTTAERKEPLKAAVGHILAKPYFFRGPVCQGLDALLEPLRRRKPTMYFVGPRTDIFHKDISFVDIAEIFAVMAMCPQHTFQLLTKKARRMAKFFSDQERYKGDISWAIIGTGQHARSGTHQRMDAARDLIQTDRPLPNVWLGITAEDQQRANERVPLLLQCPAAVRFVSVEPMLGPVDLLRMPRPGEMWDWLTGEKEGGREKTHTASLDWVICGGESGKDARPMHPDWARADRDQCEAAGVPFFFKQWGEWLPADHTGGDAAFEAMRKISISAPDDRKREITSQTGSVQCTWRIGKKAAGRLLDGKLHDAMPEVQP